jgi:hypothetical protein
MNSYLLFLAVDERVKCRGLIIVISLFNYTFYEKICTYRTYKCAYT